MGGRTDKSAYRSSGGSLCRVIPRIPRISCSTYYVEMWRVQTCLSARYKRREESFPTGQDYSLGYANTWTWRAQEATSL